MWHGQGGEVLQLESVCVLHWAERWLQVTCCTSVACLVIKRIIISCGVQPKKKTTQCAYVCTPLPPSSHLPSPAAALQLPLATFAFLHAFLLWTPENEMRRAADKKDFADQKDATTLLSGMVCNCDHSSSLPHSFPIALPAWGLKREAGCGVY